MALRRWQSECISTSFVRRLRGCNGLMIPDTQIGGTLTTQEVFNEKTTSFLYP